MIHPVNYTLNISNLTGSDQNLDTDLLTFETSKYILYAMVVIHIFIGTVTVLGNFLVLYAAYGNRKSGRLSYLNIVIKSLAVNDLLLGLFGTPCRAIFFITAMRDYHIGE